MKYFIKESSSFEKPMWLPQMRSGVEYVKQELDKQGIKHGMVEMPPKELIPLQKNVKKSKVEYFQEMTDSDTQFEPIYVADDNSILDGHHRAFALMNDPLISRAGCFKIYLGVNDAARVLNKVQDKYDFETNFNPETDDILTFDSLKNSDQYHNFDKDSTLSSNPNIQEEENETMDFATVKNNPKTVSLYKGKPINTKARTGDFLTQEQKKNFNHKYDIQFENLLEISEEELKNYASGIDYIVEKWFQGVNMKEESVKHALTQETHTYRQINEKAKKLGYDGIKYGDKFYQIINK